MKIFASYYYKGNPDSFGNSIFEVDQMPQTANDITLLTQLIQAQLQTEGKQAEAVVIISYQKM